MVIKITYPNHGHGSDFLCFLLMSYYEFEKCSLKNMLNMENYRQLPARLYLISKQLASCLLTACLFSTDISPVCSPSKLLPSLKFPYKSPAFSTYVVCRNV